MPRVIWKGAISFGLVHVPVGLYPASQEIGIDFDWIDKLDPGSGRSYRRINKRTGKEVDPDDIVKGIKQPDGEYVVLSEDEIRDAYPVSTQTIAIETFVPAGEIPFTFLEKPYYLAPLAKGEKVYALLREAMKAAQVIGIARVVMHTKERLAALIPDGDALLLNTIRWAEELRSREEIAFPAPGKGATAPKEGELKMAIQLVRDMTGKWNPDAYADKFTTAIHALAAQRVKAGKTAKVTPLEDAGGASVGGNVVDLTELLKKSLSTRKAGGKAKSGTASRSTARKAGAEEEDVVAAKKGAGRPGQRRTAPDRRVPSAIEAKHSRGDMQLRTSVQASPGRDLAMAEAITSSKLRPDGISRSHHTDPRALLRPAAQRLAAGRKHRGVRSGDRVADRVAERAERAWARRPERQAHGAIRLRRHRRRCVSRRIPSAWQRLMVVVRPQGAAGRQAGWKRSSSCLQHSGPGVGAGKFSCPVCAALEKSGVGRSREARRQRALAGRDDCGRSDDRDIAVLAQARIGGRVVAVVGALVVLALLLQPWWLAPLVSHRLSASSQRQVHIDAMWMTLTGALRPVVHFRGVRVDNAPWADSRRPFAALGAVTAVFSWQSLRERRPVIALLILRDGEIDFERRADGLRNWRLRQPDDRGPGRFKVLSIRGDNASVRFLHGGLDLDLEAKATANVDDAGAAGGEALPIRLAIRGTWRKRAVRHRRRHERGADLLRDGPYVSRARGQVTSWRRPSRRRRTSRRHRPRPDRRCPDRPDRAIARPLRARARQASSGSERDRRCRLPARRARRLRAVDRDGPPRRHRRRRRAELEARRGARPPPCQVDERVRPPGRPAWARRQACREGRRASRRRGERAAALAGAARRAASAVATPAPTRPVDAELSFAARRLHGEAMPWLKSGRVDAALVYGRLTVSHFDVGVGAGHATG